MDQNNVFEFLDPFYSYRWELCIDDFYLQRYISIHQHTLKTCLYLGVTIVDVKYNSKTFWLVSIYAPVGTRKADFFRSIEKFLYLIL